LPRIVRRLVAIALFLAPLIWMWTQRDYVGLALGTPITAAFVLALWLRSRSPRIATEKL
jgi:hypothetical protein